MENVTLCFKAGEDSREGWQGGRGGQDYAGAPGPSLSLLFIYRVVFLTVPTQKFLSVSR